MYRFFDKGSTAHELLTYTSVLEIHHDNDRVSSFQKRTDYEHSLPEEYMDVDAIFGSEDEAEDS